MKFRVNVVCIIERDGNVLMGRKAHGVGPYVGCWLLPGGGINLGEESLVDAMKRETLEETNLKVTQYQEMSFGQDVTERHGDTVQLVFLYYKITGVEDWGAMKPGDDLAELKWIPFDDLGRTDLPPVSIAFFKRNGYLH